MTPCCEGATSCVNCGYSFCREEEASPGEDRGLCATCHTTLGRME